MVENANGQMVSGSYDPILQINFHAGGSNLLDPPKKIILLSYELILCGSPTPMSIFLNFPTVELLCLFL